MEIPTAGPISSEMVVSGYPRFQSLRYWFSSVDPWPEYWGDDWDDTDDVYVDYIDNG